MCRGISAMTTPKPIITFENVTKRFGKLAAVDNVSLTVNEGEFFALLGPSGCGKTTLLRMLAGFETPTEGRILIDGQDISNVPPNKRPVNMVFQSYAVFPHMTVADNVAYGLKVDNVPKAEREARVAEALELVQLGGLGGRKPDQLSGGQRQRVALARALVKRPRVLLLDEPLSALDAKLREQMRTELCTLQEKVGITFIMVTHDQDEALALASRCAVMSKGLLQQVATPSDLYEFPNSRFVADFIGQVNLFEGVLAVDEPSHAVIKSPDLPVDIFLDHGVTGPRGGTVWAAIRPEKIELHKKADDTPPNLGDAPKGTNAVEGVIKHEAYLGGSSTYEVEIAGGRRVKVQRSNLTRWDQEDFKLGETVWLCWHACSPAVLLS
ncbi:ABC transporter ATP-binding protein [Caulobacter vibrioides]|uniref:Spermidine/putrescine import ATP-binding protein PotA n=2 Tax=Caulobacter vibrioides TaxID=155892 RepID=Q9A3R8_CAUVC|nr:ABC transporter ATP-binding protein [Caulobacter vibrioides]YP_002518608.1 spermidine/putrescine transport ATP-binding protein potA [Caulobacter vibrioides NA1000]AAK25096.1 spermidine/putrescine ABC transporter, ATP-binding protein [Caulobacter vibrioides CB15]ACL96700.1 spermidine/putrescine transport ATP-binding protein potA [Caulobacter vibrioides NA1000]ATC29961.1 ABC transporter ATP-binding protein [Caulobacter vibrioides]QXZ51484.1 ABC transporter ATP-binding protein [Caulobacter vib